MMLYFLFLYLIFSVYVLSFLHRHHYTIVVIINEIPFYVLCCRLSIFSGCCTAHYQRNTPFLSLVIASFLFSQSYRDVRRILFLHSFIRTSFKNLIISHIYWIRLSIENGMRVICRCTYFVLFGSILSHKWRKRRRRRSRRKRRRKNKMEHEQIKMKCLSNSYNEFVSLFKFQLFEWSKSIDHIWKFVIFFNYFIDIENNSNKGIKKWEKPKPCILSLWKISNEHRGLIPINARHA